MNLLLLLTALFASLTGAGAGDRVVRQVQGVAVVQAAQAVEAARPSQRAIPAVSTPRRIAAQPSAWPQRESTTLRATYLPFERRLE